MILKKIIKKILELFYTPNKLAMKKGVIFGKNCIFGKNINFGSEPYLITIGNSFYSSSNIQFVTHDGSVNVLRNLSPELKEYDYIQPINIGNNVFIGYGVVILPGTVIGDNIIIGASSVVKGTLESNHVYAGIPVKKISSIEKYKQKNEQIFIKTKNLSKDKKKDTLIKMKENNAFPY